MCLDVLFGMCSDISPAVKFDITFLPCALPTNLAYVLKCCHVWSDFGFDTYMFLGMVFSFNENTVLGAGDRRRTFLQCITSCFGWNGEPTMTLPQKYK